MIPKVIHCCWLSKEPKTELAKRCMASWRKFAPDWTIHEWSVDEVRRSAGHDGMPSVPPFFEDALKLRKWAFAADWVRFAALQSEGGVYLDLDVELVAPLEASGEFVAGQWLPSGSVGLEPAVVALEKGSEAARAMVAFYASAPFDVRRTTGEIMGEVLRREGLAVEMLPPEVFCPIGIDGKLRITARTVGIHRYAMSWATPRQRVLQWLSWHGMRWAIDLALRVRRLWRGR